MEFWKNKKIIVTGGSKGLGLLLTRSLLSLGAQVGVIARDSEQLNAIRANLNESHQRNLLTHAADLSSPGLPKQAIEALESQFEGIDWLFNCVGASTRCDLRSVDEVIFRQQLEINFLTAVATTQAALPHLLTSHGGIVNIASLAAKTSWPHLAPYVTSKAALAAYTSQLRYEFPDLYSVLLVCPGPIRRDDAGNRYDDQTTGLPEAARRPGAGARIRGLDPEILAGKILIACIKRRRELVVPTKANWVFKISCLFPKFGDWIKRRYESGD